MPSRRGVVETNSSPFPEGRRGTLLVLTSSYPKNKEEPSGIFLHHLNRELVSLGWEVVVLTPNFPGGREEEMLEGVQVLRFNYFAHARQLLCYGSGIIPNLQQSPLLWLQVPFYLTAMLWRTYRQVRRGPVDVVNAHWILPQGIVAAVSKILIKVPLIVTAHGSDMTGFNGVLGRTVKRWVLRRADAVSANSQFTLRQIQALAPGSPVELIPMGVDLDQFQTKGSEEVRRQLKIEGEFLLYVGRLVEEKGPQVLLQAMPRVLSIFPLATLVMIGGGTQRAALEERARGLGIAHAVRFLGRISHHELGSYYKSADVFVGPSLAEGLGIVFLEAAASGATLVGCRVGGVSDILIDEVTGLAVEPGNPDQFAHAVIRVLQDSELRRRLAANARKHVEENFGWKRIAALFDSLFQRVLQTESVQRS